MKFITQSSLILLTFIQTVFCFTEITKPPIGPPQCHPGVKPKCLDVQGARLANGTPVQLYDCNRSIAQDWDFSPGPGPTAIRLRNTNFCLDAGSNPANGIQLKIWQCFKGIPAQTWRFDQNKHIILDKKGLCVDLRDGITTNGNPVQTWQCDPNNQNQVWVPVNHP